MVPLHPHTGIWRETGQEVVHSSTASSQAPQVGFLGHSALFLPPPLTAVQVRVPSLCTGDIPVLYYITTYLRNVKQEATDGLDVLPWILLLKASGTRECAAFWSMWFSSEQGEGD